MTVAIVTALKMAQALGMTLADLFSELEQDRRDPIRQDLRQGSEPAILAGYVTYASLVKVVGGPVFQKRSGTPVERPTPVRGHVPVASE